MRHFLAQCQAMQPAAKVTVFPGRCVRNTRTPVQVAAEHVAERAPQNLGLANPPNNPVAQGPAAAVQVAHTRGPVVPDEVEPENVLDDNEEGDVPVDIVEEIAEPELNDDSDDENILATEMHPTARTNCVHPFST